MTSDQRLTPRAPWRSPEVGWEGSMGFVFVNVY
jgi:hypothetical protein